MDDQGRRIGLLFVYEAVSRDDALVFAQEHPFTLTQRIERLLNLRMAPSWSDLNLLIEANHAAHESVGENTKSRLFVNYAKCAGDKSRLATVRPAHWEYDRTLKNAGKLALAGALADDGGGLFVYNVVCREESMSSLKQDPFALEGVLADYELLEWLLRYSILICSRRTTKQFDWLSPFSSYPSIRST
jgi:uncharacterized protein